MTGFTLRLLLAGVLSALTFVGALAIGVSQLTPDEKPLPVRIQPGPATVSRAVAAAIAAELDMPMPDDILALELTVYADAKRQALAIPDATRRVAAISEADRKLAGIAGKNVTLSQTDRVDHLLGLIATP